MWGRERKVKMLKGIKERREAWKGGREGGVGGVEWVRRKEGVRRHGLGTGEGSVGSVSVPGT